MLHFEGGCTLEIMSRTDVDQVRNSEDREFIGFAHLAFSTGSKDQVDRPGQQPDRNQCLTDQIPIIRMPQ